MYYTILAVLVCFISTTLGLNSIAIQPCEDNPDYPLPLSFTSVGCTAPPCPLVRGTTSNANITFRIPEDTHEATVAVRAKVAGFWVPFAPPDNNVCHHLMNSYCPLDKNEVVIYNMAIAVQKFYPPISLTLQVKFHDERNKIISCMQVDCKVVKTSRGISPRLL